MKRVIDGAAYNTATALHVARAKTSTRLDQNDGDPITGFEEIAYNLYRTKGGAFFLVAQERLRRFDAGSDEWVRNSSDLYPLRYEQAHAFAQGKAMRVGALHLLGQAVEILVDDIFPTVPEAVDETPTATA